MQVEPLTATIGAEVAGVDLRDWVAEKRRETLIDLLAKHQVIFFRDQALDDEAHLGLAGLLGPPSIHPFERALGRRDPIHKIVDKPDSKPDRAGWHTDDSYLECPPGWAVLRCEVAPASGGDTIWCNMVECYARKSEVMRHLLDGLQAVHSTDGGLLDYVRTHLPPDRMEAVLEEVGGGATHPLVRTHPITGQRALFFEPNFVREIVGMTREESRWLLGLFARWVTEISIQCRFRWRAGDVAIWDERTTQHAGSADHAGQLRVLKRCTVEGERPH